MPLEDPRRAEPGPGHWQVRDLDQRLDVTGGQLLVTGSSTAFDRTSLLLDRSFTRRRGRYLEMEWTATSYGDQVLAWQKSNSAGQVAWECGVRWTSDGYLGAVDDRSGYVNARYPYSLATSYIVRVYDGGPFSFTASGGRGDFFVYVRPASSSFWFLLWRKRASSSALTELYAAYNNKSAVGSSSWVRIRPAKLPTLGAGVALPVSFQKVCGGGADGLSEVVAPAPASGVAGLTFRGTDANNLWKLVMNVTAQTLDLYRRAGGVDTLVDSLPQTWQPLKPYVLAALTFGNEIRTFVGREEKMYLTHAFNNTADQSGVLDNCEYYNLRVDRSNLELQW